MNIPWHVSSNKSFSLIKELEDVTWHVSSPMSFTWHVYLRVSFTWHLKWSFTWDNTWASRWQSRELTGGSYVTRIPTDDIHVTIEVVIHVSWHMHVTHGLVDGHNVHVSSHVSCELTCWGARGCHSRETWAHICHSRELKCIHVTRIPSRAMTTFVHVSAEMVVTWSLTWHSHEHVMTRKLTGDAHVSSMITSTD